MPDKGKDKRFWTRRSALVAVVVLGVGVIGARSVLTAPDYDGKALTVAEAHDLAQSGEITLIDIRRPDEWQRTGIGEGAHPIDMRRRDFVDALTQVAGPDRNAPIALICAAGVRSARLSLALTDAGFGHVIDVPEGMMGSKAGPGWVRSGLPTYAYAETKP